MSLLDMVPTPYRIAGVAALAVALTAFGWIKGASHVQAEWRAADAARVAAADKELARLGGLLAEAKAQLAAARVELDHQKKEFQDAQNRNAGLQSDLAAGRRSLRAAVRAGSCQASDAGSAAPGQVDNGSAVTAELDGHVAAGLAELTGEGDAAIRRLNACIVAYRAFETAVNTAGEHTTEQEK